MRPPKVLTVPGWWELREDAALLASTWGSEILAAGNLVCIWSILSAKPSENFSPKEHVDPLKEGLQCGSLV